MGGLLAPSIFGKDATYLFLDIDGRFPGHDPNPLNPDSRRVLSEAVQKQGAALGMIFDGDADRVMFVDEQGAFISPDLMIAVLGHHFLPGRPPAKVLQDIRSSRAVAEYLAQWKAEVYTWRVGRAFAASRLRTLDGVYGGELAGHYYFRDFFFSDSGMLAALLITRVAEEFAEKGIPLSALIQTIQPYHNSGEINFRIEDKAGAIQAVLDVLPEGEAPVSIMDFDGYRLDFPDWWFNIRASNTEPYLRFIAEAKYPGMLASKLSLLESVLNSVQ
jgi:phosphomannomutase